MPERTDEFYFWLEEQLNGPHLHNLFAGIAERAEGLTLQALEAGDTDFIKGQVKELAYIKNLPQDLYQQWRESKDEEATKRT